jgi:hypothetical protein
MPGLRTASPRFDEWHGHERTVKTIDHADLLASPGTEIRLADFDPALTCDFKNKHDAQDKLQTDIERLALSRTPIRSRLGQPRNATDP